jgi:hypothetical protein
MENRFLSQREGEGKHMVQQDVSDAPLGCPAVRPPLDRLAVGIEQKVPDAGESQKIAVFREARAHPWPPPASDSHRPAIRQGKPQQGVREGDFERGILNG